MMVAPSYRSLIVSAGVILALLGLSCSGPQGKPGSPAPPPCIDTSLRGTWTQRTGLNAPRAEGAVAELDGKIYVIGGGTGLSGGLSSVEIYDPALDRWQAGPELPGPRCAHAAVTVGDAIYVMGGAVNPEEFLQGKVNGNVVRLRRGQTRWEARADMPTARAGHASVVLDGHVWVLGGALAGMGPGLRAVESYNPVTDQWSKQLELLDARYYFGAAVRGGKIYVAGGSPGALVGPTRTVTVFDPIKKRWSRLRDLPTPNLNMALVEHSDHLVAIGGALRSAGQRTAFSRVDYLDARAGRWLSAPSLAVSRGGLRAVVKDGRIFAIGGLAWNADGAPQPLASVEVFEPVPRAGDQ